MATADSTRRGAMIGIAAVVCSLIIPGTGHLVIHADTRRARVLVPTVASFAATLMLLAIAFRSRSSRDLADVVANRVQFLAIAIALVVLAGTRIWTALDVAWAARPESGRWHTTLAAAVCVSLVGVGVTPLLVAADYVRRTDRALDQVFGNGDAVTARPGSLPTTTERGHGPPVTYVASTTSSTLPPFPGEDRVNILLLGGDAGAGRYSLRTDTMVVVSIDPDSGDTAMISVPRNLTKLPFPPDTVLGKRFPDGFNDLANAVYTVADRHRDWAGGGEDAGAQAIKLGIAQLLGIPIQYYVLVDMEGFVDVVDALGGITVNVTKRVPTPGNPYEAKHPVERWIEVGRQRMDGTIALAYARSRKADSDYERMDRQRCVLAGIAAAASPLVLAAGLGNVVDAFGDAVRTDIPRDRLSEVVRLVERFAEAGGLGSVDTLVLAPPVIQPSRWKAERVRELVATLLAPTAPAEPTDGTTPSTPGEVLTADCA